LQTVHEVGLPGAILVFGLIFWVLAWPRPLVATGKWKNVLTKPFLWFALEVSPPFWCIAWPILMYIPANALVFTMTLAMAWSGAHPESALQGNIP
jgi:hypothetical protein